MIDDKDYLNLAYGFLSSLKKPYNTWITILDPVSTFHI